MTKERWQEYRNFVQQVMEREQIAGAAVAVAVNGEVVFQEGFGYRDVEQKLPVTPETIFGTASVSKSFTALAIMQLMDRGLLDVNDPVIKYLPEFNLRGVLDMSSIKVYHLLSHTTGTPPMRRRQDLQNFAEHLGFLASEEYELLGQPGEYFSYCNDTFLLLGAIIERLTGRIYRKYMTQEVLDVLEMNRSTYSIEELTRFQDVTVPYLYQNGEHRPQDWPALGNFEVGGGVRSCVTDMLHYGQLFVNGGKFKGCQVVSATSLEKMWQPVYLTGRKTSYCFALSTTPDHGGYTLVEHGGSQPGVASNFGFVPEAGVVAIVLTNTSGVSANALWLAAVNTALGLPVELQRSVEPAYQASEQDIEKVLGTYTSAEGGRLEVLVSGGQLTVAAEGKQFPARLTSEQSLVFTANTERLVKFYFRGNEPAWAAFVGMRMLRRN